MKNQKMNENAFHTNTMHNKELYEYIMSEAQTNQYDGVKVAMIPVELLHIDYDYQRRITAGRWQKIANMAEHWSPLKAGMIVTVARPDESCFAVVDGQGRVFAAKQAGIQKLRCMIAENMTKAQEAQLFVSQGENYTPLTPYDKFIAYLEAGKETDSKAAAAVALNELCNEYGVTIKKVPAPKEISTLRCLATAWNIMESYPDIMKWIFNVMKATNWHISPNAYSEANVLALKSVYMRHKNESKEVFEKIVMGVMVTGMSSKTFELTARASYPDCSANVALSNVFENMLTKQEGHYFLKDLV